MTAYTTAQVLEKLQMPRRTFFRLRAKGELPMLDELKPRLGRVVRYRAAPIDRWVDGQWGASPFLASHRRHA